MVVRQQIDCNILRRERDLKRWMPWAISINMTIHPTGCSRLVPIDTLLSFGNFIELQKQHLAVLIARALFHSKGFLSIFICWFLRFFHSKSEKKACEKHGVSWVYVWKLDESEKSEFNEWFLHGCFVAELIMMGWLQGITPLIGRHFYEFFPSLISSKTFFETRMIGRFVRLYTTQKLSCIIIVMCPAGKIALRTISSRPMPFD